MLINLDDIKPKQKTISFPKIKINFFCIFVLSIPIWLLLVFVSTFCPNFLVSKKFSFDSTNFCVFYIKNISIYSTMTSNSLTIINLILEMLHIICQFIFIYCGFCTLAILWKYEWWFRQTIDNDTQIISSCQHMNFNDKIAMIVTVYNDFSPNTIIQTANQTYKNIDVWILNDSTNANLVKEIKKFCIKHKFYFLQHNPNHKQQHPTKIGNIFYFLKKYGKKYDYIFENDSSSIVSNNFVYNALCFLHSPLLNHKKDACVVCNGTFYGMNNLHSFLYQQCVSLNTSGILNNHIDTNKCLTGYAMIPYGYCCLIKTSVFQKIPINKIESTLCDTLRGYWLLLNNYKIYFDPFDFGGKIATQSIWDTKNQRFKWIIADIFAYRKSKLTALKTKYNNTKTNYLVKATSLNFLLTPIIFIFYFIKFVFWFLFFVKNRNRVEHWFNFTSFLLTTILIITLSLFIVIISLCKYKKQTFTYLLIMICSAIIEISLSLKRFFVIITHFFINNFDWKKICVITTKKRITFTCSKIIKQILFDTIIVLILIAICLIIQFSYVNKLEKNSIINLTLNLWLSLFMPLFLPSISYIILNLIGNIKTKIGYDFNVNEYKFWHHDFRYKYVKKSTIWKQQNPNDF